MAKTSSPSPAKTLQTVDLPERAGPTTGAPHIQFSPIKSGISGAGARHQTLWTEEDQRGAMLERTKDDADVLVPKLLEEWIARNLHSSRFSARVFGRAGAVEPQLTALRVHLHPDLRRCRTRRALNPRARAAGRYHWRGLAPAAILWHWRGEGALLMLRVGAPLRQPLAENERVRRRHLEGFDQSIELCGVVPQCVQEVQVVVSLGGQPIAVALEVSLT